MVAEHKNEIIHLLCASPFGGSRAKNELPAGAEGQPSPAIGGLQLGPGPHRNSEDPCRTFSDEKTRRMEI